MSFYLKKNTTTWKAIKAFYVKNNNNVWSAITDAFIKTATGWKQFYSSKYAPDKPIELLSTTGSDGYTLKLQGKNYHWTWTPTSLRYYFYYIDNNNQKYWLSSAGGSSGTSTTNPSTNSYTVLPSSTSYITIDPKGSDYVRGGTSNYYFQVNGTDSNGVVYPASSKDVVQIVTPSAPNVTVSAYDTTSITIQITSASYNDWLITNRYIIYTYDSVGGTIESGGGRGGFAIEPTYGSSKSITLTGLTRGRDYLIYVAPFTGNTGSTTSNATGYAGVEGYVLQQTVSGYYVTYNANGGSNAPTDTTSYGYNDLITVKTIGSMTYGTKFFANWNTKADGTGTSYNPGGQFYITGPITLYAIWKTNIYPPNAVAGISFASGSSSITWTFQPSVVDSTHDAPTGYSYITSSGLLTPSNGDGMAIDAQVWQSTGYSFAIQLLTSGSTWYGYIQPYNTKNGTTQYGPWTRLKAQTTPPAPTYSYYYGLQNIAPGGINISGDVSSTSLSYTVYRTGNGTANPGNSYVGYGNTTYSVYATGTMTKSEGSTYFGTYYPPIQGYYYIVASQSNLGGSGPSATSQISPQNWFWGTPPAPSGGTVTISTNTGNYTVGSIITYSTSGWSPAPSSYNLELHCGTNPVLQTDPLRASTTSSSGTYTITTNDIGYYFKAFATATGYGTSSVVSSSQSSQVPTPPTPPGPPTNITSSSTTNSITLNFTPGARSTSTRAYLNGGFDGSTSSSSYTFSGLSANTAYILTLYGYDGTLLSDYVTGTYYTQALPAKPTNTSAPVISKGAGTTINVTDNGGWTGSPTSYRYQWYSVTDRGGTVAVGTNSANYNYGTNSGNTYYVLVWASNAGGESTNAAQSNSIIPSASTCVCNYTDQGTYYYAPECCAVGAAVTGIPGFYNTTATLGGNCCYNIPKSSLTTASTTTTTQAPATTQGTTAQCRDCSCNCNFCNSYQISCPPNVCVYDGCGNFSGYTST
jgi:hypothetical protein